MLILPTTIKRFSGLIIGLSVLLQLLTPFAVAEAVGAPPTHHYCYDKGPAGPPVCFPNLGACQGAAGTAICKDTFSVMSPVEQLKISQSTPSIWSTILDGALWVLLKPIEWLAQFIFYIAGLFLTITGQLLDMSISRTIDHDTYTNLQSVNVGWTIIRDFSNMFFIFALLYIAILTIVGSAGSTAKRWVTHLIIAALLINFSLFFTQVVIDAGNILAKGFWDKITTVQGGQTINSASTKFLQGFRVQTTWDTATNNAVTGGPKVEPPAIEQRILIYLGGALVMFVAGYVFLAGAIMMIIRTITLLIVMIASPFAFLGFALPNGKGKWAGEWLSKLTGATFVAPALVIMLYIDSVIINTTDMSILGGGTNSSFAMGFEGSGANFAIFYQFILLIILLLASLKIAHSVGNGVGSQAGAWAKKGMGYGSAGTFMAVGATGRQIGGRFGKATTESETLNKMAKSNNRFVRFAANTAIAGGKAAKTGTWDIRNAPMGGLGVTAGLGAAGINSGAGSKKSFATAGGGLGVIGGYRGSANEEAIIKEAKARFPNNAVAQQKYIQDKLGANFNKPKSPYTEDRNKDVRNELERKVAVGNEKEQIKSRLEEGKTIGEEAGKAIRDSFTKLGAKDSIEMLSKDQLKNPEVHKILNKQQIAFMAANPEKYQEALNSASSTIMSSGGEAERQYVLQQVKMQNPAFQSVNLQDELGKRISTYESEVKSFDPNTTDSAVREKHFKSLEQHDSAIQDIASAMKPKDIARLPNELKKKPALVRNYTDKHFNEIESYHKNIVQDADKPEQQQMFADIRTAAQNQGTKGTQEYMGKAKKKSDSVYFDTGSQTQLNQDLVKAKSATAEAEKNLNTAKASGLQGRVADAERAVTQAKNDERTLESKLGNNDSSKNDIGANSGDDEDEDEV